MGDQCTIPAHYAILVGINAYPDSPLESCVRDVQKIKECLENKLPLVSIQTLTASGDDTPLQYPESWPTSRNVTSALETVTSRAQPGDFIYIHYSGHGTRLEPCYDFSSQSTGDLALVLLDEEGKREIPLPGPRLAGLLKCMVDKALVITLVLDCCFSASAYRNGDPNIRYLSCGHIGPSISPPIPELGPADGNTRSTSRDASMHDNWLLEPDRYTILAACGPNENAKGGSEASGEGESYGALSYFLFKALSDYGLGKRHKDIYRHICAKFWEVCQVQHPVLYGNEDQAFFGRVDPYRNARSTSIFERDRRLQLLVGQAHGLRHGDHFALSPFGSSDCDAEGDPIAKVTRVWPLTSELELLGTPSGLQTGSIAEPLTCSYLSDFPIRLAPELQSQNEWRVAFEKRSLSICIGAQQNPAFQVMLSNDIYEILDEYGCKVINLPAMPRDQTEVTRVCNILEHLVRFWMTKDINNEIPKTAFKESLEVRVKANGNTFAQREQIEVRNGSIVELIMRNLGETDLYFHVYDLGPFWQIKGLLCASYEKIPQYNPDLSFSGMSSKKIKMTVPPSMYGYGSCEDIIKVFVTSHPTSFDLLELPKLDELGKTSVGDRIGYTGNNGLEDWVALNFPIRTLYEEPKIHR